MTFPYKRKMATSCPEELCWGLETSRKYPHSVQHCHPDHGRNKTSRVWTDEKESPRQVICVIPRNILTPSSFSNYQLSGEIHMLCLISSLLRYPLFFLFIVFFFFLFSITKKPSMCVRVDRTIMWTPVYLSITQTYSHRLMTNLILGSPHPFFTPNPVGWLWITF